MKQQVFVIHGGDCFDTYEEYLSYLKNYAIDFEEYQKSSDDWKRNLPEGLGAEFEVIRPEMPNKRNAKYLEWKIWFEKFIPNIADGVILVGHSLGGIFLAKYLSEVHFPKKIKAVFLVAAPFDKDGGRSIPEFGLNSTDGFKKQVEQIFLYHSKDDMVVNFEEFEKFQKALPDAKVKTFEDRGHFNQPEFPELVDDIKKLS